MAQQRLYRTTVTIPISVSWHKELVDDGSNGKDFYMRITPHVNLGGKSGVPLLKKHRGAIWQKTELQKTILNAKLKQLLEKAEKETKKDAKAEVIKGMQGLKNKSRQQPASQDNTINNAHAQRLERNRRQHGISLEDQKAGEEERKRQQEGDAQQKVTSEDMMQKYGTTDEEKERVKILLGKSTAGYDDVMKVYNETKVGYDDDDYGY